MTQAFAWLNRKTGKSVKVAWFLAFEIAIIAIGPYMLVFDQLIRQGAALGLTYTMNGTVYVLLNVPIRLIGTLGMTLLLWYTAYRIWMDPKFIFGETK